MIVRARSALRLGLAGGGSDVSPYCDTYGGYVLNTTIDKYAYAVIKVLDEPEIRFRATDLQKNVVLPLGGEFPGEGDLRLHKAVYNHIIAHFHGGEQIPLELTTFCDAPPGSGLGASSTLVVTMIRAFVELLNLPLDDYSIARIAFQVERVECGLQGGRQDQYSATFGGFNFMEFYADNRAVINPLRIKEWIRCELETSLLLYYTGQSRDSSRIIEDQSKTVHSNDAEALQAMHGIKEEALAMKECLLKGDFAGLVDSMRQGWESKKRSAKCVSNPFMNRIYDAAMEAGALVGKVSGAGGGGYMLFLVPPEQRMNVVRRLEEFKGLSTNCHFSKNGSQAWKLSNGCS
ncbi:MAG: GHMP kinase [Pseudodesulfovibrio sp.]|uniref:GHMP family kinase ATP-binding protein n=1 Tax=Pseudodesulfovibrio sp. TaxID=2035812 RepID=UPI003D114507